MSPKKVFKWSSHKPVLLAALDLFKPRLILELGVGNFSTPVLIDSPADRTIHVENDGSWLAMVQEQHGDHTGSEFMHHSLPFYVTKSTRAQDVDPATLQSAQEFYQDLKQQMTTPSCLIFVDHFTCLRTLAINTLFSAADCLIYHDAETPEVYDYQRIDQSSPDFDRFVLKTPSSWTGFWVRRSVISSDLMRRAVMDHAENFGRGFGLQRTHFEIGVA